MTGKGTRLPPLTPDQLAQVRGEVAEFLSWYNARPPGDRRIQSVAAALVAARHAA